MKKKELLVDYWNKKIPISVPEDSVIGEIPNPAILPNPEEAIRKAITNPIGSPPLSELAKKARNGIVTICHDDQSPPPAN